MRDHRKLSVWRRAHDFAVAIRRATRSFPRSGYGSVRTPLTRAAESIALTIVEGAGAATKKEFVRFLDMSIKSTTEVEEGLELSHDYGILDSRKWRELSAEDVEIRKMLCGLRARILEDAESPDGPG